MVLPFSQLITSKMKNVHGWNVILFKLQSTGQVSMELEFCFLIRQKGEFKSTLIGCVVTSVSGSLRLFKISEGNYGTIFGPKNGQSRCPKLNDEILLP